MPIKCSVVQGLKKKILNKRSPISDNGCDVYMLNSAIEYNDCVKWSSLGQFPTLLPLVGQMNSPTLKSCYWLRLLLHVDSKCSVSFNQIWIWIIFSDWFANIEAFCSDRAISWIAWCQMSFVNAFYWSYCERFNHAPFIFFIIFFLPWLCLINDKLLSFRLLTAISWTSPII